jgi:hypothetical protein
MTLLSATGARMVELGGARAWRVFNRSGIVASLQWLDCGNEDGPEPVLALFKAQRSSLHQPGAFVIAQTAAHEWMATSGHRSPKLLAGASFIAGVIGFDRNDKAAQHTIISLVEDTMADLVRMPASLPADVQAAAQAKPVLGIEATVKINGNTVQEAVF